jgi:hypothetical protein
MIWIEAIMAFAVTMMAFATIVSMIVEMIHRIFRLREEKLKMMLNQVYTNQIVPMVSKLSSNLQDRAGQPKESPGAAPEDKAEKIKTDPLTVFKRAAAVMAYTRGPQILPRPLFDINGNVLKGE